MPILLSLLACGDRCDVHGDCADDELCWAGECEPAMERDWLVDVVAAEVGWTHPDGEDWDPDDSPPDLYVEFGLDGSEGCFTSYVPEAYDPIWDEQCELYVPEDPIFLVNLWDDDPQEDDFAAGYYWEGSDAFVDLARTAGEEIGVVDETGEIWVWLMVRPL
jgi:hypothetical protein